MKKILAITAIGLLIIVAVTGAGLYWVWSDMQQALDRPIYIGQGNTTFEIKSGATLKQIAEQLHAMGCIENPLYLRIEARRANIATQIKAGLFEISDKSTPRELLMQFVSGKIKVFQITFVEGTTFREFRNVLKLNGDLVSTIDDKPDKWVAAQIATAATNLEGQFFPSTYYFSHGDTDIDVLRRAHVRMRQLLESHWNARASDLPYETPQDALTMASIIEKETGRVDERAAIAGVFVRRLRKNMKLQTDPSVIYGLGEAFDGNLRRIDLQSDTPYNTYTRRGLPPSPIAMPSEGAIQAALHPAAGTALYFVGKGDGSHAFSDNLKDHNAAVHRYQIEPARARR